MRVTFNMNYHIKLKPTDQGLQTLANEAPYMLRQIDEDGYVQMQLWHAMQIFGPHMVMGFNNNLQFETEIVLLHE